jgi:2-polyprenyl-6-methoxyphenol hydroxylase-like FAD-dependent oxidoreductase
MRVLIAGLAASLALLKGKNDIEVMVLEKDAFKEAGYGLGVSPLGAQALQDVGFWSKN